MRSGTSRFDTRTSQDPSMTGISPNLLWDIFRHVRAWLANLNRAGQARKIESVKALREVVTASRETAVYIRQMHDTGKRDHGTERHLTVSWTRLGFALRDLGIEKLAKRCQIAGKDWSMPGHYDKDFLDKADISLDRMEQLAREILHQIEQQD